MVWLLHFRHFCVDTTHKRCRGSGNSWDEDVEYCHEWLQEATMTHKPDKPLSFTLFLQGGCLFLLILMQPIPAPATTYYVAMTGNDSNPGTLDQPWRHPQRCVDPGSPLVAGDTCLVGNGTYTDTDGNGIVIYVRRTAPSGTAAAPITLKSETPLGAVISMPTYTGPSGGIYISQSNYIIEGFDVSGGMGVGPRGSAQGIAISAGVSNTVIRRNAIHGQGWGLCSNGDFGQAGILFGEGANDILIEENKIYQIGRLRNGENGCSTDKFHHDHGIYSAGSSNVTIRRNVIYNTTRGYPIHLYESGGGTHNNIYIFHNTLSGGSPTGAPPGQIMLCNTLRNVQIKNNIFHNPPQGYAIEYCYIPPITSDLVISYNLTDGTRSDFRNPNNKPFGGMTYSTNKTNVNPMFVNAESHNYALTATSPAINAGTKVGLPYLGSAPDIGAYEFSGSDSSTPLRPADLRIQ